MQEKKIGKFFFFLGWVGGGVDYSKFKIQGNHSFICSAVKTIERKEF